MQIIAASLYRRITFNIDIDMRNIRITIGISIQNWIIKIGLLHVVILHSPTIQG